MVTLTFLDLVLLLLLTKAFFRLASAMQTGLCLLVCIVNHAVGTCTFFKISLKFMSTKAQKYTSEYLFETDVFSAGTGCWEFFRKCKLTGVYYENTKRCKTELLFAAFAGKLQLM